ncbi:MAG TPA: GDSL-type esterase/lipase family protein, partial [Verrucomicrobiales bacterium]|nr:GDSL-type esterase/lipase family protein [Verrucomicrobiales bacterium]
GRFTLRSEESTVPVRGGGKYSWMTTEKWNWFHQGDLDRAKAGPVDVLFLGDSITECWDTRGLEVWNRVYEPMRGANFGVGGDTTQNQLWRITEGGALNGISPRVVVLMIGTNNIGLLKEKPAEVAKGVAAIIDVVHSRFPKCEILLLSIFPRGRTPADEFRRPVVATNELIKSLGKREQVTWLELWDVFLAKDGTISKEVMADYLHPTPLGYQIWAKAMAPTLDKLLKKTGRKKP